MTDTKFLDKKAFCYYLVKNIKTRGVRKNLNV